MSAQDKYSLQERGRFKAWWDAARPLEGSAFPYEIAWAAWQAALSAQPSPGGQGDDLAVELLATELERDGNHPAADSIRRGETTYGMKLLHAALRAITAALAARQPVGEPAYNSAGISLTACQLHEALLMAGDPELDVPFEDRSLVRIFWTETGHSGPGLYCECVGAEEEGCILLDGTAPAIGQSAQAVDLGQFRDLAEFALQNAKLHNCWEKREALARNLLALIDSQAVGK
ncbi:TPA: hypothetical protein ACGW13_000211 [Stenotrophomonas maltophilia]|uniref:hypothetical protein n=1 Tax=Stenotrophomonas maltophilia TaxID=40324 RepID=UPI001FA7264A|nr:hypothetical protein [Stenotrophomonas maltophilia]